MPNDITLLDADSIVRTQAIPNLTTLLETRVPGLDVQRTSGAPGDPARLRLRGASSPLRNNDPIVVVDGIRVYAEQSAARSANLVSSAYAALAPFSAGWNDANASIAEQLSSAVVFQNGVTDYNWIQTVN